MEPLFTPEQLAEIKSYHSVRYWLIAIDAIAWPVVLALTARFGARPLYSLSQRLVSSWRRPRVLDAMWRGPGWAEALVFSLLLFAFVTVLYLPLTVYFGYVREHQYGLSTESLGSFAFDEIKRAMLSALSMMALGFGLFGLARRMTSWWWVIGLVASVLMVASTAIDPYRSRVYVDQLPLEEGPLRARISELMASAQIDFRDVLVDKTAQKSVEVQAYFAGQGPTRTIVLNDTLLAAMSTDEVLAAVAHEAGHVHEPRWLGRLGSSVALVLFLLLIELVFRLSAKHRWGGITERADIRTLPLIFLLFELSTTLIAPISGWQSRQRELAADQYAIALTGDAASFRAMLVKAARINKMDPEPPRWIVWRGLSHPPIAERLDALVTTRKADGG